MEKDRMKRPFGIEPHWSLKIARKRELRKEHGKMRFATLDEAVRYINGNPELQTCEYF